MATVVTDSHSGLCVLPGAVQHTNTDHYPHMSDHHEELTITSNVPNKLN